METKKAPINDFQLVIQALCRDISFSIYTQSRVQTNVYFEHIYCMNEHKTEYLSINITWKTHNNNKMHSSNHNINNPMSIKSVPEQLTHIYIILR